ncbi:MAG: ImmA/IrrE family metallo-endopeptidase [bacterium]|nr:ImmA/IrrE family metallo-endopeptidase [bacterium]
MKLPVKWLGKNDLKKAAEEFSAEYNPEKAVPVPIDSIIESRLNIDIVPMAGLKEELDNDGFISRDFTAIHIDQNTYFNVEVRYRFSLAHELGHFILHKDIYRDLNYTTVDDWADTYQEIDSDDYGKLEFQANYFAGCLLIPDFALWPLFQEALKDILPQIKAAQEKDIPRETYLDSVIGNIARKLAPHFNVSYPCMENRFRIDEIYSKPIP